MWRYLPISALGLVGLVAAYVLRTTHAVTAFSLAVVSIYVVFDVHRKGEMRIEHWAAVLIIFAISLTALFFKDFWTV